MKNLSLLTLVALLLLTGATPVKPSEFNTIHWVSKTYTDLSKDEIVHQSNVFVCTREGVTWSRFDENLPVVDTKWELTGNLAGTIVYTVKSAEMSGTIRFNFTEKTAVVKLTGKMGNMHFKLVQDQYAAIANK